MLCSAAEARPDDLPNRRSRAAAEAAAGRLPPPRDPSQGSSVRTGSRRCAPHLGPAGSASLRRPGGRGPRRCILLRIPRALVDRRLDALERSAIEAGRARAGTLWRSPPRAGERLLRRRGLVYGGGDGARPGNGIAGASVVLSRGDRVPAPGGTAPSEAARSLELALPSSQPAPAELTPGPSRQLARAAQGAANGLLRRDSVTSAGRPRLQRSFGACGGRSTR